MLNSDKDVVKGDKVTVDGGSNRCSNDREYTARKRVKTFNSFHNEELGVKLKKISGDISVLRENKLIQVNFSKKRNNAPVPIELWLF